MFTLLSKICLALVAVFVVGLVGVGVTAAADDGDPGVTVPPPTTTHPAYDADGNPWHD